MWPEISPLRKHVSSFLGPPKTNLWVSMRGDLALLERPTLSSWSHIAYMGGCQNYGLFLGPYYNTPKGILTTTHMHGRTGARDGRTDGGTDTRTNIHIIACWLACESDHAGCTIRI